MVEIKRISNRCAVQVVCIAEVCRIFATAECIAFHIRNALGTVAGDITLNIAHNKLLHVKALVAEILQSSCRAHAEMLATV